LGTPATLNSSQNVSRANPSGAGRYWCASKCFWQMTTLAVTL